MLGSVVTSMFRGGGEEILLINWWLGRNLEKAREKVTRKSGEGWFNQRKQKMQRSWGGSMLVSEEPSGSYWVWSRTGRVRMLEMRSARSWELLTGTPWAFMLSEMGKNLGGLGQTGTWSDWHFKRIILHTVWRREASGPHWEAAAIFLVRSDVDLEVVRNGQVLGIFKRWSGQVSCDVHLWLWKLTLSLTHLL